MATKFANNTVITLQQAAEILKVSRPRLMEILEAGYIPSHGAGQLQRVSKEDLLLYQEQEETRRHQGLDELVAEAQKLEMY